MEQNESDPDFSHGDQSEDNNEKTFKDLDVELDELLWDMERLNEVDQDLDEDDESSVMTLTSTSQPTSTESQNI